MIGVARVGRYAVAGIIIFAATFSSMALSPAHADPFEIGLKAYGRGDYQEAFAAFSAAAEEGHPAAQYSLAVLYHAGRGVKRDHRRALNWYRRAVANGIQGAAYRLDTPGPLATLAPATKKPEPTLAPKSTVVAALQPQSVRPPAAVAPRPNEPVVRRAKRTRPWADLSDADVEKGQRALQVLGYEPGFVDGVFGPRTEAAMRAFLADNGLWVNGRVDKKRYLAMLLVIVGDWPPPPQWPN